MADLMRYAAVLEKAGEGRNLPPVEKWNPDHCGEIDIAIKRDGTWFHEGSPINRAQLVRLFSTVIRKDDDDYFLVTPVEKLKIKVEDAPFIAVLMRVEGEGAAQRLIFTTNMGDEVVAGPDHQIEMRLNADTGEAAPYIHIRRGLDALIARAVFYDLAALGETRGVDDEAQFGVMSDGVFFPLGAATDEFEGL